MSRRRIPRYSWKLVVRTTGDLAVLELTFAPTLGVTVELKKSTTATMLAGLSAAALALVGCSADTMDAVDEVSPSAQSSSSSISLGASAQPEAVIGSPGGKLVDFADSNNKLRLVGTSPFKQIATVTIPEATKLAISANGKTLAVAGQARNSFQLSLFPLAAYESVANSQSAAAPAPPKIRTVKLPALSNGVAFSPDGSTVYATGWSGMKQQPVSVLSRVKVATGAVTTEKLPGSNPGRSPSHQTARRLSFLPTRPMTSSLSLITRLCCTTSRPALEPSLSSTTRQTLSVVRRPTRPMDHRLS